MNKQNTPPAGLAEMQERVKRFMDILGELTDGYEKANPEWIHITLAQILYKAVLSLRACLADMDEKEVTWENALVELKYPIEADWEKVEPVYFHVTAAELESPDGIREKLVNAFITVKEVFVFRRVTREILTVKQRGKFYYKHPLNVDKKLAKLSKQERARRIKKMVDPIYKQSRILLYDIPHIKKRRAKAFLTLQFRPCLLDLDAKEAYYPLRIGLRFTGLKPKDMDEGTRAKLLDALLLGMEKSIPEENLEFIKAHRPTLTLEPVREEAPLVRVGLHVELQKFGHRPKQLSLFDGLLDDTRKEITEKSIEVVGLDISQAQNQALFAIQKLLDDTGYRGNIPGRNFDSKGFSFTGLLPALQFSPAQYLEAFGLTKRKTGRGWEEYSAGERREALQALADLSRPYLFVYTQTYYKDGKPLFDRVEKISPLITITRGWEALTKNENTLLAGGKGSRDTDEKLKAIAIEPAPIIVQGIDRYFVLKPANYAQEIKFLCPHASKFVYRLVDWLIAQAEIKRRKGEPLTIKENIEEIAYHLRMDAYIKTRQLKRIRQIINKCYQAAKDLGYLLSYETVRGQTKDLERLELNPEKFTRVRKIEEERGRVGEKPGE